MSVKTNQLQKQGPFLHPLHNQPQLLHQLPLLLFPSFHQWLLTRPKQYQCLPGLPLLSTPPMDTSQSVSVVLRIFNDDLRCFAVAEAVKQGVIAGGGSADIFQYVKISWSSWLSSLIDGTGFPRRSHLRFWPRCMHLPSPITPSWPLTN